MGPSDPTVRDPSNGDDDPLEGRPGDIPGPTVTVRMGEGAAWPREQGAVPAVLRLAPEPTSRGGRVTTDAEHMKRAIELAGAVPFTSPNPRVGAVLVRGLDRVGEAAHHGAGTPHAEVGALAAAGGRGGTLYVTLEPCTHEGRTPPCVEAILGAGVERVVVAVGDPDSRVAGRGIEMLCAAGVEVTMGVAAREATRMNAAYLHQRRTGRSFVTLKLALSLDGRLAAADGGSRWITGPEARGIVHSHRARADAVMVGAGTIETDDPSLTARDVGSTRQPARVVVDAAGRIAPDARVFGAGEVVVATTESSGHERQTAWKEAGAEVLVLPSAEERVDLRVLLDVLGRRGWLEVYCEGGPALATSLLRRRLVDRLQLHFGGILLGESSASLGDLGVKTLAGASRWDLVDVARAGNEVVTTFEPSEDAS